MQHKTLTNNYQNYLGEWKNKAIIVFTVIIILFVVFHNISGPKYF